MRDNTESSKLDRREAIVTIGKFSAFTAPAMVSLLVANPAEAFAGSGAGGLVQTGKIRKVLRVRQVRRARRTKRFFF